MSRTETALADQRVTAIVALAAFCAPVLADEDEEAVTDMEFLEYLGSWEETDEEWQLLDDAVMVERKDAPQDTVEDSASEKEDEG